MSESFFRPALRDDGTEITVEIEVQSWGSPAQTSGPPEACDPGDPMECYVKEAWLTADEDKADAPKITLTDDECARIEQEFLEDPPEYDYGDDYD